MTVAAEVDHLDARAGAPATFLIDATACPSWRELLGPILGNPEVIKVLHNAKFDLKFLMKASLDIEHVFDTMIAAQLLDSGQHVGAKGYFTLAATAERYLRVRLDKALQASEWGTEELSQAQLRYAARDSAVLLRLCRELTSELSRARLVEAARLEMEALPAVAWMELAGAPLDCERWSELAADWKRRGEALAEEAKSLLGRDLNLASRQQLREALAAVGVRVAATDEKSLRAVQARHPAVKKILEHREAAKRASTWGNEFVAKHVHAFTRRIHADYHQIGAATGRMSCSKPNLQSIPHGPAYRRCFEPVAGRVLVVADLSQVELCVAAELSGDARMIQAINDRKDLHRLTAASTVAVRLTRWPPRRLLSPSRHRRQRMKRGTYRAGRSRGAWPCNQPAGACEVDLPPA